MVLGKSILNPLGSHGIGGKPQKNVVFLTSFCKPRTLILGEQWFWHSNWLQVNGGNEGKSKSANKEKRGKVLFKAIICPSQASPPSCSCVPSSEEGNYVACGASWKKWSSKNVTTCDNDFSWGGEEGSKNLKNGKIVWRHLCVFP